MKLKKFLLSLIAKSISFNHYVFKFGRGEWQREGIFFLKVILQGGMTESIMLIDNNFKRVWIKDIFVI